MNLADMTSEGVALIKTRLQDACRAVRQKGLRIRAGGFGIADRGGVEDAVCPIGALLIATEGERNSRHDPVDEAARILAHGITDTGVRSIIYGVDAVYTGGSHGIIPELYHVGIELREEFINDSNPASQTPD